VKDSDLGVEPPTRLPCVASWVEKTMTPAAMNRKPGVEKTMTPTRNRDSSIACRGFSVIRIQGSRAILRLVHPSHIQSQLELWWIVRHAEQHHYVSEDDWQAARDFASRAVDRLNKTGKGAKRQPRETRA